MIRTCTALPRQAYRQEDDFAYSVGSFDVCVAFEKLLGIRLLL